MAVELINLLQQFLLLIITLPLLGVHSKSLESGISFDEKVFIFSTLEDGLCTEAKTAEDVFLIIGCNSSSSDSRETGKTDGRHLSLNKNTDDCDRHSALCLLHPSEKRDVDLVGDTPSLFTTFLYLSDTCESLIDERIENSSSQICVNLTNVSDICKQKSNLTLNVSTRFDKGQAYGFPFSIVKVVIKTPNTLATRSIGTTEKIAVGESLLNELSPLLLVGTKDLDCYFDRNCRWKVSKGRLKLWSKTQTEKCDYCNRLSSSENFGYLDIQGSTMFSSPYIFGSSTGHNLIVETTVVGNANLSALLIDEDNSTWLETETDRSDSNVWKPHSYYIGEQRGVFKIAILISIMDDNSSLALRNIRFSRFGSTQDHQDCPRECNFNEPCQLIQQKSGDCELRLEKIDPTETLTGDYSSGFLFTWWEYCKQNSFASFQTIMFQPQPHNSPDEECKISFSIYGFALWTWWLCESEDCTKKSILKSQDKLIEIDSLISYEMTIKEVPKVWFLKFEAELFNSHFLGINTLAASGTCFKEFAVADHQEHSRDCNFNEPCTLIRKMSDDCQMKLEKTDPTGLLNGDDSSGFLFTWLDYCNLNSFASFQTITFQPQPNSSPDECKISFSVYGFALWTWWLCEDEHCYKKSKLKSQDKLIEIDSLITYEMTIKGVPKVWFLKFETADLYTSHYVGIDKLAASSACFNEYIMNITTNTIYEARQTTEKTDDTEVIISGEPITSPGDVGDSYKNIIIPVAVLCVLLLILIVIIGIKRRKLTQFQIFKGSRKIKDRNMSISELLTMNHSGKTLDRILTEGNPNYNWFQHKFQHGYIRFYDRSRIQINNVLGKGAFGEVYKGTILKLSSREKNVDVAIKKLSSQSTEKEENNFLIEAFTLCKFNHKNIVRCLGISSDNGQFAILLELMVGGDLKSFLLCTRDNLTQRSTLRVEELIRLGLDIATGCSYLEANKFVHRDIAARNCLLTTHGVNRVAKIADFGMARDIVMKDYYKKEGRALLPVRWMPPEAYQDGIFTVKSDVWAFGILLWEIFTSGYIPYPGLSNDSVMGFVSRGGRLDSPSVCPQEVYDLMLQCWSCLQSDRPTFQKILQKLTVALKNSSDWDQDDEENLENPKTNVSSSQYYVTQIHQEEVSPLM